MLPLKFGGQPIRSRFQHLHHCRNVVLVKHAGAADNLQTRILDAAASRLMREVARRPLLSGVLPYRVSLPDDVSETECAPQVRLLRLHTKPWNDVARAVGNMRNPEV
jgi:hypothetical protein